MGETTRFSYYEQLNIFKLNKLYYHESAKIMYKYIPIPKLLIDCLLRLVQYSHEQQDGASSSNKFYLLRNRTKLQTSFKYQGAKKFGTQNLTKLKSFR